eukprot:3083476-Rhodomonas_salina.2
MARGYASGPQYAALGYAFGEWCTVLGYAPAGPCEALRCPQPASRPGIAYVSTAHRIVKAQTIRYLSTE